MGAPVCQIGPLVPNPSAPEVLVPSIPIATASNLVEVVNAIGQWINQQMGNTGNQHKGDQTFYGGFKTKSTDPSRNTFKVVKQTIQPIKVYDPNDPTKQTYVTVNQVTGLTMYNPTSKETWLWKAPTSTPGQ